MKPAEGDAMLNVRRWKFDPTEHAADRYMESPKRHWHEDDTGCYLPTEEEIARLKVELRAQRNERHGARQKDPAIREYTYTELGLDPTLEE